MCYNRRVVYQDVIQLHDVLNHLIELDVLVLLLLYVSLTN